MDYTLVKSVNRKPKKFSKALGRLMIVLAVVFALMGIIFQSGYFLPAILLVMLYYFYVSFTDSGYEYLFENEFFSVDVIRGRERRSNKFVLYYKDIEVVAPHDHPSVRKYKKDVGTEQLKKYDFTSYDDDIPYYTMIVMKDEEKIKLLLDLDEEDLMYLKQRIPAKVYFS